MERNTFKTYLRKVQDLQVLAYEHGLDMSFGTRDAETCDAWMVGHVYKEGAVFGEDTDGDTYIYFYFYNWQKVEKWDKELDRIEDYIKSHGIECHD